MPISKLLADLIHENHPKVKIDPGLISPSSSVEVESEKIIKDGPGDNSPEEARSLGILHSGHAIHIKGHVSGETDPYDYFKYFIDTIIEDATLDVVTVDTTN